LINKQGLLKLQTVANVLVELFDRKQWRTESALANSEKLASRSAVHDFVPAANMM